MIDTSIVRGTSTGLNRRQSRTTDGRTPVASQASKVQAVMDTNAFFLRTGEAFYRSLEFALLAMAGLMNRLAGAKAVAVNPDHDRS